MYIKLNIITDTAGIQLRWIKSPSIISKTGIYHNSNGPSHIEYDYNYITNTFVWQKKIYETDGVYHRLDGPAVEIADNQYKFFYINGFKISNEFEYWLKAVTLTQQGT